MSDPWSTPTRAERADTVDELRTKLSAAHVGYNNLYHVWNTSSIPASEKHLLSALQGAANEVAGYAHALAEALKKAR